MPKPTAEQVRELLHYNPETGQLTWRAWRGHTAAAGSIAGYKIENDRRRVKILDKPYYATHLIWLIVYGRWPADGKDIDHINRNPSDDRLTNLREVNRRENACNNGSVHPGAHATPTTNSASPNTCAPGGSDE